MISKLTGGTIIMLLIAVACLEYIQWQHTDAIHELQREVAELKGRK